MEEELLKLEKEFARAMARNDAVAGAVALGAIAIGALAMGALAIGRLAVGRARIRRLEIDELKVRHLCVGEDFQIPPAPGQPR